MKTFDKQDVGTPMQAYPTQTYSSQRYKVEQHLRHGGLVFRDSGAGAYCHASIEEPVLLTSPAQVTRIEALRKNELSIFQSVSMALQDKGTSMSDMRTSFDEVVFRLPETAQHLSAAATIVKHHHFENAIVKIQQGIAGELTTSQLKALLKLIMNPSETAVDAAEEALGFAGRALKRRRLAVEQEHQFIDTSFLQPTSNIAERLFSTAKRLYNDK